MPSICFNHNLRIETYEETGVKQVAMRALKSEATFSSETTVDFQRTTGLYFPVGSSSTRIDV
jgi:hypothetical protein